MHLGFRRTAAKGFIWTSVEAVSQSGVKLIAAVILARLLTPAEYGVVALLMPIMAVTGQSLA